MSAEPDKLLTPREVSLIIAKAWGRSEPIPDKTLREWRNAGRGPYWIVQGAKPKYPRSKLTQWLTCGELAELEDSPIAIKIRGEYADQIADLEAQIIDRDERIALLKRRVNVLERMKGSQPGE